MASPDQIHANRANARRSTGPRTAEGKAKSSQNALKHGLRAQATVLPDENIDDFHVLVAELEDQFQPANVLEWTLLRQLADAEWRMRRVPRLEAGVLASELHDSREHYEDYPEQLPDDPALAETIVVGAMLIGDAGGADALSKLSRYEARLSHRYFKALEHLLQAQDRRNRSAAPQNPAGPGPQSGQTKPIATPPPAPAETGRTAGFPAAGALSETKSSSLCASRQLQADRRREQALPRQSRTREGAGRPGSICRR